MSVMVKGSGGVVGFSHITPAYFRGTNTITGLTVGHRYMVVISNLQTSGSEKNVNGQSIGYTGFTDVELGVRFGDGKYANASQRVEGGFLVGKATSTTATVGTAGSSTRQAVVVFDLGW